ncbi:putative ribonuclease H-like domain-containing protein, partial [Tanacetum coccineum]
MQQKRQHDVLHSAKYYTDSDWTDIMSQVHANQGLTADLLGHDVNEDNFAERMVALIAKRRREFAIQRTAAADLQSQNIRRSLKRPSADLEQPSSKKSKSTEVHVDVPADSTQTIWWKSFSESLQSMLLEVPFYTASNTQTKLVPHQEDGDPEADFKMCIKYASDADSASDDDTPVNLFAVVDWELLPTGLGWINVLYKKDNSRKCFTSLREILHLVTRVDLMTIYGRVMTFYQDKQAEGVGLVLWGDLKVLIDSPEVNDGSEVWKNQNSWNIQSWKLYSYSGIMLEICQDTVGNELTTAVQLIAFLKTQIADSRRPKVHDWYPNDGSHCHIPLVMKKRLVRGLALVTTKSNPMRLSCFDADFLVADSKFMKVAFGDGFKMLLFNPLVCSTKDLSRNLKLTTVSNSSLGEDFPTGKDNSIVSTGSTNVIPAVNTSKAQAVNIARPKTVKTARPNSVVVNAVRGKPLMDDKGFLESGCSRHMTGNIAYLSDFKEFYGGYVTFGGGAHGGFDMKNIVPKESLTCLVAKATLDESMLWHRRLGHINFKNINKLVKDNLVRGLPTKRFEMTQTVLLVLKEAHRLSCTITNESADALYFDSPSKDIGNGEPKFATDDQKQVEYGPYNENDETDKFKDDSSPKEVDAAGQHVNTATPEVNIGSFKLNIVDPSVMYEMNRKLIRKILTSIQFQHPNTESIKITNYNCDADIDYKHFLKLYLIHLGGSNAGRTFAIKLNRFGYFGFANGKKLESDNKRAYAYFMGFLVYQMDVKSAFLYGTIEEEVYVTQPPGFKDPDNPNKVYKVVMVLYGLHQAPRAWYETLANYLLGNGFQRGKIDQTLFIKRQKGENFLVQVYVDDIIFGSTNKELCTGFKKLMKVDFEKPLVKDGDANDVDVHLYRSMIRYLKGKPTLGLWYSRDSPFKLVAYTDSDYAGATQDRKSTTGGYLLTKGFIAR